MELNNKFIDHIIESCDKSNLQKFVKEIINHIRCQNRYDYTEKTLNLLELITDSYIIYTIDDIDINKVKEYLEKWYNDKQEVRDIRIVAIDNIYKECAVEYVTTYPTGMNIPLKECLKDGVICNIVE